MISKTALLALAFSLAAHSARAETTKAQCVKANANGQTLRLDGKFNEAREQLQACGAAACPQIVRNDCAQRLSELERTQPTIVFDVKDGTGADIVGAGVTMDGRPLAEHLAGTAIRVDTGEHEFVFTVPGQPPVTRKLVVQEGEKDRRERIVIGPVPQAEPLPTSPAVETSPGLGTRKVLGLAAGGVGVVGVAVGSIFGVLTFAAVSDQKKDCAGGGGSCPNHAQALSDHTAASSDSVISTAAFVAGGALLAGGAVLFFAAPRETPKPAPSLAITPLVGPGGLGLILRREF
jgi:hypothetical protein